MSLEACEMKILKYFLIIFHFSVILKTRIHDDLTYIWRKSIEMWNLTLSKIFAPLIYTRAIAIMRSLWRCKHYDVFKLLIKPKREMFPVCNYSGYNVRTFRIKTNILFERKWAHKIGKLQEPPTRNIPCLNV